MKWLVTFKKIVPTIWKFAFVDSVSVPVTELLIGSAIHVGALCKVNEAKLLKF